MSFKPLPVMIAAVALIAAACNSPNSSFIGDSSPKAADETTSVNAQISDLLIGKDASDQ